MFKKSLVFLILMLSLLAATAGAAFAEGRKAGLFIGINEYDGKEISKLRSCVNDAISMKAKLANRYGFQSPNLTLLTDAAATRKNILENLASYEKQLAKGDLFVFYYSGHGSLYPDALTPDRDETRMVTPPPRTQLATGYYDSTLVPVDGHLHTSGKNWGNKILDDELNAIFSRFTAKGVQVIFISDSCHSGTLAKSLQPETNEVKFVSPQALGFDTTNWNQLVKQGGRRAGENFNNLLLVIASSQDSQFSAAWNPETGTRMSLFTYAFLKELESFESSGRIFTYQTINDDVNRRVHRLSRGSQTPRLDDRFFEPSLLNKPIFSLSVTVVTVAGNNKMRIVVQVTDENGVPVSDAAFGVFPLGAPISKDQIREKDILITGSTDREGLFDSASQTLELGRYQVKVVKAGYRAFAREMEVVPAKDNTVVFVFTLVAE